MSDHRVIACTCGQKLRVPQLAKTILVTCSKCGRQFDVAPEGEVESPPPEAPNVAAWIFGALVVIGMALYFMLGGPDPNSEYIEAVVVHQVAADRVIKASKSPDEAAAAYRRLHAQIQAIPADGVDERLVDWSTRYCASLISIEIVLNRFAKRSTWGYGAEKAFESFIRGAYGDPLGAAIEEQQRHNQDKQAAMAAFEQQQRLLGELQSLVKKVRR